MVSTEYIRQQIGHFRDGIAAYGLGDLYEDELAVFEECLAYREGYDPKERLPEEFRDVAVRLVGGGWEAARLEGKYWASYARCYVTDEIDRWYPLPGGE